MTASGRLVPLHPEPVPIAGENASWDAFWAETKGGQTTTIRGVELRVPTGITLAAQREMEQRARGTGVDAWAPVAEQLFRGPDGLVVPDLWATWRARGMEMEELSVLITWGMSHGKGVPISFAEAYRLTTDLTEGKDQEEPATKKPSPAGTGGPSKPRSSRRTASTRSGSPA